MTCVILGFFLTFTPLPSQKQPAPPVAQTPSAPLKPSQNHLDWSQSPSTLISTTNPVLPLQSLLPMIPPKPRHYITSTVIKQSLQATKATQIIKKAEEQLDFVALTECIFVEY